MPLKISILILLCSFSACAADDNESSPRNSRCTASVNQKNLQIISTYPSSGRNLFNWDCESLLTSVGEALVIREGTSLDNSTAWNGSYSMKLTVIGNDGGNQARGIGINESPLLPSMIDGTYLFYRFNMNIAEGFSWGLGTGTTKANRIKQASDQQPTAFTGLIGREGVIIMDCQFCNKTNPTIPYDFNAMAGTGWHEYVVVLKKQNGINDRDGSVALFVDGQFRGSVDNLRFYGIDVPMAEAWGGWMVSPYFQLSGVESDGGTIWIDDVSTDTFWNSQRVAHPGSNTPQSVPTPTPRGTPRATPRATPRPKPSPTPRPTAQATPRPTPRPAPNAPSAPMPPNSEPDNNVPSSPPVNSTPAAGPTPGSDPTNPPFTEPEDSDDPNTIDDFHDNETLDGECPIITR